MQENIVIIPTYNEKENIEKIINMVFNLPVEYNILIIDDNSPDGTGELVKTLQNSYPGKLFLLERSGKQGLGTAYIEGFKWALAHDYEYIFQMDADFSHNPEDLIRLYNSCAIEDADLSIGSRYISGVNVINWPFSRVLISYFASVYVRMITGMKIMDTTAGFKCYKRKVLEKIDLDKKHFKGYAFQIEMKFNAWKYGFKIVEIPIIFTERREGSSKMNKGIVYEAVWGVIKMKISSLWKNYK